VAVLWPCWKRCCWARRGRWPPIGPPRASNVGRTSGTSSTCCPRPCTALWRMSCRLGDGRNWTLQYPASGRTASSKLAVASCSGLPRPPSSHIPDCVRIPRLQDALLTSHDVPTATRGSSNPASRLSNGLGLPDAIPEASCREGAGEAKEVLSPNCSGHSLDGGRIASYLAASGKSQL
jgi:hypothetical protein